MTGAENSNRQRDNIVALEGHSHVVGFYEKEVHLVDFVRNFLAPGLLSGNAAIMLATDSHRDLFDRALMEAGIDARETARRGQLIVQDVSEVLSMFMVERMPDPARFRASIGEIIFRAAEGPRDVRIFGEMVAVLGDQGNVTAAIALEGLWNDLATRHSFLLYCAYPIRAFVADASAEPFRKICEQHSRITLVRSRWPGPAVSGKRSLPPRGTG